MSERYITELATYVAFGMDYGGVPAYLVRVS